MNWQWIVFIGVWLGLPMLGLCVILWAGLSELKHE